MFAEIDPSLPAVLVAAVSAAGLLWTWRGGKQALKADSSQALIDGWKDLLPGLRESYDARLANCERTISDLQASLAVATQHTQECEGRLATQAIETAQLRAKIVELELIVERRGINLAPPKTERRKP